MATHLLTSECRDVLHMLPDEIVHRVVNLRCLTVSAINIDSNRAHMSRDKQIYGTSVSSRSRRSRDRKPEDKAALKGRSLEQELREVLTAAAPLTAEEKIALFRKIRAKSPSLKNFDIGAAIRAGRDDEFTP